MTNARLKSSILVKPVSSHCNMRCDYCFYLGKEAMLPKSGAGRMSDGILEELISQVMEDTDGPVGIAWQGGEPTLAGLEFFERVVALERRYGRRGQVVSNAIQTNGVLLDDKWAEFLARYRFLVGLSLDGPSGYHDSYRKGRDGSSTYHLVHPKIELLKRFSIAFNVLIVLNDVTVPHPRELFDFCLENDLRFVQFIPAVEVDGDGMIAPYSVPAEEYGDFLCTVFDLWYNDGAPFTSIRFFEACTEYLITGQNSVCFFRDSCDSYLVVEADGSVFPCDFFVEPAWRVGKMTERPLRVLEGAPLRKAFAAIKSSLDTVCLECEWLALCEGGCPRYRSLLKPNYLCQAYRRFFAHAMPRLKDLARVVMERRGISPCE